MCCGRPETSQAAYPREATMPDGSKVMVSSAAMERTEREKVRTKMRTSGRTGYTVRDA